MSDHPNGDFKGDADQHRLDLSSDHIEAIDVPGIVPDADDTSSRAQPRKIISKLMIMAPAHRDETRSSDHRAQHEHRTDWDDIRIDPAVAAAHDGQSGSARKMSAIIIVAVVAGIAGAVGTAMATAGVAYFTSKPDPAIAANKTRALDESMTRIEADLAALRSNVDRVAKANASQAGKTADRLDRIEKAQADPAAKLAKLTDSVEKLRVTAAVPPPPAPALVAAPASAPAPAPVASAPAKDVTGSIPAKETTPLPTPKPEIARLPIVEDWALLEAANGGATIESRRGIFEVFAGDPVPGLGRVDAIRRQDGRWVVVTTKGLIVAR